MASVERELEQQLREAGNKLAELPSSVDELLPLLDQVETFLSRVEQSPPESMQNALAPSLDALIKDELLMHSDFDVKVAVASCISEITRITAPEAPYQDDKMKEVFHLIVSSFENLSDKSSRSFNKMASILETVAKVRSCVVMLDLECDGLIVEMFQHFLKSIRDHHSENVFTSMETIMCLVLEESEEISLELLTPLLASVKNNSEEVKPIARKLGERVFENCAPKLKSYLSDAVKSLGISLDDYSKVVASVCEGRTVVEHNDDNTLEQMADERKLINTSSDEAAQADESKLATSSCEPAQAAKEIVAEDASPEEPEEVELPADRSSPKAIVSNGVTETGNEETLGDPDSSKEPENADADVCLTNKSDAAAADSDPGKSTKPKPKQEQSAKRKGKKTSSVNSVEPSDPSGAGSEKEAENPPVRSKNRSTVVPPAESNEPSDIETEAAVGIELSPKKTLETEAVNAASPSPSGTFSSESRQKKGLRTKKKEVVIEEEEEKPPSVDESSKKEEAEVASGSQAKRKKQTAKKTSSAPKNDKILAVVGTSKKEGEKTNDLESPKPLKQSGKKGESSDSEAKPLKQAGKKGDSSNNNVEEKSSLRKKDRKGQGRGRGKDTTAEDLTTSLAKDDVKETVSSPKSTEKSAKDEDSIDETPKTDAKRKRSTSGTGKNKGSTTKELAENLVGLKVKVYWPEDKKYYKGVIESYDPAAKKHKVSYDDGDTEVLLLKDEKWDVIEEDPVPNEEKETEDPSPDASPEMQKKKKAKTNPESSAKQEKTPVSPKRSGAASSGKAKGTAAKSGGGRNNKSKVDSKVTSASKPSGKSEENSGNKSQENSKKNSSNKGFDDTLRSAMKPKSKQETPKTVTKSKGKTPKSGGSESNANGSGKAKSSLAKGKETNEDSKGKTAVSAKTPESAKGKATESASKSGKKRKKRS